MNDRDSCAADKRCSRNRAHVCVSKLVRLTMCSKVWQVRSKRKNVFVLCHLKKASSRGTKIKAAAELHGKCGISCSFCKPTPWLSGNTDTNLRAYTYTKTNSQQTCLHFIYYFRSSHLPLTTRLATTHGSGQRRSAQPLLLHRKTICMCVACRVEKLLRHKVKNVFLFTLKKFHCSYEQTQTHTHTHTLNLYAVHSAFRAFTYLLFAFSACFARKFAVLELLPHLPLSLCCTHRILAFLSVRHLQLVGASTKHQEALTSFEPTTQLQTTQHQQL